MQIFLTKRKTSSSNSNLSDKSNQESLSISTKQLKIDDQIANAEQEIEFQQETNRSVELLINQKTNSEQDNTPKILLNVMIFKGLVDTLTQNCRSDNINTFTFCTIIASIFALGDLESTLVIMIVGQQNWDEMSELDGMFFKKPIFAKIYKKLVGEEGDLYQIFIFFQFMFVTYFSKVSIFIPLNHRF